VHKALSIVGARPNFIKLEPVHTAIKAVGGIEHIIVHTGQHYDANLSDDLFKELEIPTPNYNLGIGSGRQAQQLGQMIAALDEVMEKESPDLVLVYGDTNSTAAGAIAAAKNGIKVAHIEAGLREYDKLIPEEVNKLLTTSVADLYFCPTETGVANLQKVGITQNVHLVGDVGIDLIFNNLERISSNWGIFEKLHIAPGQYYFLTCHRANNTDNPVALKQIIEAMAQLELPVVFPIHPRTVKAIDNHQLPNPASFQHVHLVPPLGFFDTQTLIRFAKMVITDSGGVVKEAYFHQTLGIIIDKQIEWIETVEEGWNRIAGPDCERILSFTQVWKKPEHHSNCLGDGSAALKIAKTIKTYFNAKI
jgi:UDP-N-acetylglucosamine 2-epimerase (non-hydrolysing)